ncbi:hypothetical protein GCM10009846_26630 [Agrococcus versicolor]|uniref:Fibronectin type-III domain-containing protein n=1 Tax=Agrococcus versicolor TaxID=501482 RepID=A0ABP5MNE6_9MICO
MASASLASVRRPLRAALAGILAATVALGGLLLAPAPAAQAAGTVDQVNEPSGVETHAITAQSGDFFTFTAGRTGLLDALDLYVAAALDRPTLTAAVFDSAGATVSSGATIVPSVGWASLRFAEKGLVTAGQTYVVRIENQSSAGTLVFPLNDGYPGGSLDASGGDLAFRTYVDDTDTVALPQILGTLPDGVLGRPYSAALTLQGTPQPGVQDFTGTLPPGLTLSWIGTLEGTPTQMGTFEFSVQASSTAGSVTRAFTVTIADPLPSEPQDLRFEYRNGFVVVDWSPPLSMGTGTFEHYEVSTSLDVPVARTTESGLAYELGLGESADFSVRVVTSEGTGPAGSATATYIVAPSRPLDVTAVPQGDRTIALAWSPPADLGGSPVLSYVVERQVDQEPWTPVPASAIDGTTARISGLTENSYHQFRVAAVTAAGQGAFSALVSARPSTFAAAPTLLGASSGDARISISFQTRLFDGGSAITSYRVERFVDGAWMTIGEASPTGDPATVDLLGLVNGESHRLRVVAVNAAGAGPASSEVSFVPSRVAAAPGSFTAVPGDGRVDVSWTAPADGGAAITSYVLEQRPAGGEWTPVDASRVVSTTASLVGLANGTAVEVRVAAINVRGQGPWATVSAAPRTVPGAPTAVAATPGDGTASLSWTAPASDGGDAVTGYVVQQRVAGGAWIASVTAQLGAGTATVTGLTNGVAVEVRVAAVNAAGTGAWSEAASVTPRTVPGAPTGLTAQARDASVSLSWALPASDGGAAIDAWRIEASADGGEWETVDATVLAGRSTLVEDLTNGVSYAFRVTAGNVAGFGSPSGIASATPFTLPEAPTSLVATPGAASMQLSWAAPAVDGGADVTSYAIELRAEGSEEWIVSNAVVLTGTMASVSGLENGVTYDLRVAAINAAGRGPWVQASATPRTVPDAPVDVVASPRSGGMAVTWEAPAFDGGADLDGYVLQVSRAGERNELEEPIWVTPEQVTFTGASAIVDGLEDGVGYSVRVAAVNVAGPGAWSEAASTTPRSLPGAPVDLSAFASSGRVQLTWLPPLSDGGAPIERWVIEHRVVGDDAWTVPAETEGTQNLVTVLGLDDGTTYEFRVAAVNAAGTGAFSAAVSATPTGLATAVQALVATPGDGSVQLSWEAPEWNGGTPMLAYDVRVTTPDGEPVLALITVDGMSAVVSGLENGSPIVLTVVAVNVNGPGAGASVATTPFVFVPTILGPDGTDLAGSTLRAGDEILVRASDLPVGAEAIVELHSTPIELGRGLVDADGELSLVVTIPEGVPAGEHEVVVRLVDAGADVVPIRVPVTIAAPIVTPPVVDPPVVTPPVVTPPVVAPPVVVAPAPGAAGSGAAPVAPSPSAGSAGGAGHLPRTGFDALLPMLLLGAALLLVGVAARRRPVAR